MMLKTRVQMNFCEISSFNKMFSNLEKEKECERTNNSQINAHDYL